MNNETEILAADVSLTPEQENLILDEFLGRIESADAIEGIFNKY